MKPSPAIHRELADCEALLVALSESTSVDQSEALWKQFLRHLERVWLKCESHFGRSPKWNGWQGQFLTKRKKDPLLRYLHNARNADEHTVTNIVDKNPDSFKIGPVGGNGRLRYLAIYGDHYEYDADGHVDVSFVPGQLKLLPVTNRSNVYPPPTEHLGKSLDGATVVEIARAGLNFYHDVVVQTEKFFVK